MNDSELLRRYAQSGCEAAFTELVKGYIDFVYSAALRQVGGDAHLAQDVTQSVFIALAAKASSLAPRTVLSGWLYTSTRYAAAKAIRSDQRWHAREKEATTMQPLSSPAPNEAQWEQLRPLIDQAMHELRERDRDAVLLRYFEERPLAEVGAKMGLSEDAARKQVARALEKLRGLLAKRGVTSNAAVLAALLTSQAVTSAPAEIALQIAGAALAGTTAGASTSLTLFKLITMSKIKLGVVTAVIVAGIATPLLLQHQSRLSLQREIEALRDQNTQLNDTASQVARLSNLVAQAADVQAGRFEQSNELIRLRAEVSRLRGEARELARSKASGPAAGGSVDPALQAAFAVWAERASRLKGRLDAMPPELKIPELQFLAEKDWFDAVKDMKQLETDSDFRKALSELRSNAKANFDRMLQQALRSYASANGGSLPSELAQLKPFFSSPVDDATLSRYSLLQTGRLSELARGEYLVAETAPPVDDEYDTVHRVSLNGINTSTVNRIEDAIKQAGIQFAEANNGLLPTEPAQLTPYLRQPVDAANVQRMLSRIPPGVTTLEQLKASGALGDGPHGPGQ
jgi:RNA polymerase sigma factor (sigma-70 family)